MAFELAGNVFSLMEGFAQTLNTLEALDNEQWVLPLKYVSADLVRDSCVSMDAKQNDRTVGVP